MTRGRLPQSAGLPGLNGGGAAARSGTPMGHFGHDLTSKLVTGADHPACSANHLTDIDKTKHSYNQQQHKNLDNQTRTLLALQTEASITKALFSGLLSRRVWIWIRPILQLRGPTRDTTT